MFCPPQTIFIFIPSSNEHTQNHIHPNKNPPNIPHSTPSPQGILIIFKPIMHLPPMDSRFAVNELFLSQPHIPKIYAFISVRMFSPDHLPSPNNHSYFKILVQAPYFILPYLQGNVPMFTKVPVKFQLFFLIIGSIRAKFQCSSFLSLIG